MTTAAVVVIGQEILTGKFRDENGPYLIDRLRALGVDLLRIATIPDDVDVIADEVARCAALADHVITTGGVGPTHDDVTLEGVAQGLGVPLVIHPQLAALAAQHGLPDDEGTRRMSSVPAGTELVTGPGGGFPAVLARNVIVLPGVPMLVKQQFEMLAPRLASTTVTVARVYARDRESDIAVRLTAVAAAFPSVSIGSYPRFGEAERKLIVTLEGRDPVAVAAALGQVAAILDVVVVEGPT